MKTIIPKKEEVKRTWWVVDAEGKTLGRLASEIAVLLRGKHKPIYTPSVDVGDFVIVINADKVKVTGKKEQQKVYYSHSGYLGHLRETPLWLMRQRTPEKIIKRAVKGMLPKTAMGKKMLGRLKVYRGPEHPHQAQKPVKYEPKWV
ncbi:50S ribosomal protein L13 [bacterium 3DAC]|nr:50S ribosomal protein L13 [Dictyoglomota bacterium]UZN23296.1 50S ribosomal protein L13 [bacterium 3DAC]